MSQFVLLQSRRNFAGDSRSDHVALLNAYNGWTQAMNHSQGKEFVQQRFLHWGTLNMIRGKYQTSPAITCLDVNATLLVVNALS